MILFLTLAHPSLAVVGRVAPNFTTAKLRLRSDIVGNFNLKKMDLKEIAQQAINELPWETFWWVIGLIFAIIIKIPQAFWTAQKILKQNRSSLGNGSGKRLADIFLHCWYKALPLNTTVQTHDILIPSGLTSQNISLKNISNTLNNLGLTKTINNELKAVNNTRNYLVFYICFFWLIVFNGDTRDYYRKLKQKTTTH